MYAEVAHLRYEEELDRWVWEQRRERRKGTHERVRIDSEPDYPTYEVVVTGESISLAFAEFQVLKFLAQRPYHAFRVQEIVDALSAAGVADVDDGSLRDVVIDLRRKLGFFRDYVQTVPYIGYRFRP
ncbi:MAG TPA: helix-turn-helix domain-containing protein [Pirellulaceae bacterium]